MKASAPGKVMLTGEYAVLHGHTAVVAAVGRRAEARFGKTESESPLIRHLADQLGGEAGDKARTIEVDSSDLFDGDSKLGLGSSAAVAVSAAALALGTDDPGEVQDLALRAHRAAQAERGARGSGADIAASAHGGMVAVRMDGDDLVVEPLEIPGNFELVLVWTGIVADTAPLVAQVEAAGERDPEAYQAALGRIGAASTELIAACRAGDAPAAVAAIAAGASAHRGLAMISGAPLVTDVHKQVGAMAAVRRGASKPTGAGGGDIALAAFHGNTEATAFRRDLFIGETLHTVKARIGVKGVKLG
jgi:phosphomevalonate kinase